MISKPAGGTLSAVILLACTTLAVISIFTPQSTLSLKAAQLVGTWNGKESWGIAWKITRLNDGTFYKVIDFRLSDVPHNPSTIIVEGRYFVIGSKYGYFYTKSPDTSFKLNSPVIREVASLTPDKLSYRLNEGNWVEEYKEKVEQGAAANP
jgi:hypothetical protein